MKKLWKITIVLVVVFALLFLLGILKAQDEITICTGFSNPHRMVFLDSSGKARIYAIAPSPMEQSLKESQHILGQYLSGTSNNTYKYDPEADLAELYASMNELYERLKLQVNAKEGILVTRIASNVEYFDGNFSTVDVFWNEKDGCIVYANAVPIPSLHYYTDDELHALEAEGVISWDGSGFTGGNGESIHYSTGDRCFVGPDPSSLRGR
ncbi:MAG TPA: hypothetical protein VK153_02340 [Candidatus Paceibacterota bacterium]|nr:hypothetical protein [Candidatus Paceibacterota bacterium]